MRALSYAIVIALVASAALWASHPQWLRPGTSVPANLQPNPRADLGHYYRLKLDLTYKKAPIHLEIVGGCGVHSAFSVASGGSTVEILAMSAFVFGARMPEGHAIVVRSKPVHGGFNVCLGATTLTASELAALASCPADDPKCDQLRLASKERVPPDWLPLITWYEHDNDFSFGVAYATQDAYASPRAQFGFVRATVEHATREEFEAFQRSGPKNLLPDYMADSVSHLDAPDLDKFQKGLPREILSDPRKAWPFADGPNCRGVKIVNLNDTQRARLGAFWPHDHPRYWLPPEASTIHIHLTSAQSWQGAETYDIPDTAKRKSKRPVVYPIAASEGLADAHGEDVPVEGYIHDLLINDASLRGFEYCVSTAPQVL